MRARYSLPTFLLALGLITCGRPPYNLVPSIGSISPSSVVTGGPTFFLTVNGSNFITSSVVLWNNQERSTTFVNAAQLKAEITASDIFAGGTAQVTVFNPPPYGGTSNAVAFTIRNPVPRIETLSPTSTATGDTFTLTVNGSNFIFSSVVRWNGSDRTTTFVNASQLTATISGADVAAAGTAQVTVFNPPPGGGTSNAVTVSIINPVPRIEDIWPDTAIVGGVSFSLTVLGDRFISGSVVRWNGADRPTTLESRYRLLASIPATDIAATGIAQITIFNPPPSGGTTNALFFSVNNPVPIIGSLSPASATAGGPAFTLTVTGSDFVPGAVVQWFESNRATTFISETKLTASILATDIAYAGSVEITVVNPPPGGGGSGHPPPRFIINNPLPRITSLLPASAMAGGAGFPLTVNGSDFFPYSVVRWNGSNRPTAFVESTVLAATIAATDIAAPGIAQVSVFNPAPGGGSSSGVPFTITTVPPGAEIQRVSLSSDGVQGNAESFNAPAVSGDGRFVAFRSRASNLVPGDTNGLDDVFVRNTCMGVSAGCTPSTTRVSVRSDGGQADFASLTPSISADGRFVAFVSDATNLVAGDTNGVRDIFVHDRDVDGDGIFDEPGGVNTTRVNVASDGTQANFSSDWPSISPDGRFVAFASVASNLVAAPSSGRQVFLHDRQTGQTTLVSAASDGTAGNNHSFGSSLSGDGRVIAFSSGASNLAANDTTFNRDIFVRDRQTGQVSLVSVASTGAQSNGHSFRVSINADGRFVAFDSDANNLVADDTNQALDVFVRDTCFGAPTGCTPTTVRISVASGASQLSSSSGGGALSADGRFVAFGTVMIHDRQSGTTLNLAEGGESVISTDAAFLAFESSADNLVAGDTNGVADIFLAPTGLVSNPVIATTSLPDGTAGVPYSASLQAFGGILPYTWSIVEGALPSGLSLNASTGVISGTPTSAGTFNFIAQVTDSFSTLQTYTRPLSITIR